jgi:hypothetical protein
MKQDLFRELRLQSSKSYLRLQPSKYYRRSKIMKGDLEDAVDGIVCDDCGGQIIRKQAGRDIWLEGASEECSVYVSIL